MATYSWNTYWRGEEVYYSPENGFGAIGGGYYRFMDELPEERWAHGMTLDVRMPWLCGLLVLCRGAGTGCLYSMRQYWP